MTLTSHKIIVDKRMRSISLPLKFAIGHKISSKFIERHDSIIVIPEIYVKKRNVPVVICQKGCNYDSNSLEPFLNSVQFPNINKRITPNLGNCEIVPLDEKINGHVLSLFRPADQIYGHWILDILPRVWLCEKHSTFQPTYLVRSPPSFAIKLLKYLGISEKRIFNVDILIKSNNAIFKTSNSLEVSNLRYNQHFSRLMKTFGEYLYASITSNNKFREELNILNPEGLNSSKIFISRKHSTKKFRQLLNRDEIENIFIEKEFKIICPEKLSITEQAHIFRNASIIAGEDGSGLHNTIFSLKNVHCLNLRSSKNGSTIQGNLNSLFGLHSSYVFGPISDTRLNRQSNYVIDKEDILKAINILNKDIQK